jgi:diketogulonate reductase-like aldo/keto reductase
MAADGQKTTRVLADGVEIPLLGLGTWLVPDGEQTQSAVEWALEAGYRHIDTAQGYGNESSVGRALDASGIDRSEVFITTKFDPAARDPVEEAERSRERLGVERVDLYLVHWPQGGPTRVWPGMERALDRGLTRAIGVSNFDVEELAAVCDSADSPPLVNQIQLSPFQHRRELLDACRRRGVAVEAYSPLTHGEDLGDPALAAIAEHSERTPAQVLLRWGIERDLVVIPKSVHQDRIIENSRVFDFSLSVEELDALDALDRTGGTGRALEARWWTPAARSRARVARIVNRFRG